MDVSPLPFPQTSVAEMVVVALLSSPAEADAVRDHLQDAGVDVMVCGASGELLGLLEQTIGCLLISGEAFDADAAEKLKARLEAEPVWSDVPVIFLGPEPAKAHEMVKLCVCRLDLPLDLDQLQAKVEAALKARRKQYAVRQRMLEHEGVLDAIQDAIVLFDKSWNYLFVNERASSICGMTKEGMRGRQFWEIFPMALGTPLEAHLRSAMIRGERTSFEWESRLLAGRWFNTRTYPTDAGIVCLSVDITQRKQAEHELERARSEAVEANLAKDQFLAALSHELRTPLTPVLMTVAEMLEDGGLSEERTQQISLIQRNVEMEARLIDDLLDLTRVTRGKLILHKEWVDAYDLASQALEMSCNASTVTKKLFIQFESKAREVRTMADPSRIQQILWNLLNNAVKFTSEGGSVKLEVCNPTPSTIAFTVTDTGIGIGPGRLPKIFAAFEQGDVKVTRQFGGLGLGLAISRAMAELHGGKLTAMSEGDGCGATFTLEIPIEQEPETESKRAETLVNPEVTPPLRILLTEDHEETRAVLARLLRRAGHTVETAATVQEGLALGRAQEFDLVISDLGLPDGSGLDLMRGLLAIRPVHGIALSGYGMDADLKASREAGFGLHLIKPVDWRRLKAALASFPKA